MHPSSVQVGAFATFFKMRSFLQPQPARESTNIKPTAVKAAVVIIFLIIIKLPYIKDLIYK
jgi:hypothetical protein